MYDNIQDPRREECGNPGYYATPKQFIPSLNEPESKEELEKDLIDLQEQEEKEKHDN